MSKAKFHPKHLVQKQIPLLLCCASCLAALHAAPYNRLYVFGDSYSDIGEGYLDGNGPTAVAYLAQHLGFPLRPANDPQSKGQSLDFAVSGAQTGSGNGRRIGDAQLGVGMRNQVEDFAGRVRARSIIFNPETTLFFIAGGLNDKPLPAQQTVANLKREIRILYGSGARHFLLALLPTAIPAFSFVGQRLNPELAQIPGELAGELPGATLDLSHWGSFFDLVMRYPDRYGIADTTSACAGRAIFKEDTTPCASPNTHYYFHAGHPSTAVHRAVGQLLYKEVLDLATHHTTSYFQGAK